MAKEAERDAVEMAKPLAGASVRLKGESARMREARIEQGVVVGMLAAGVSPGQIAGAIGRSAQATEHRLEAVNGWSRARALRERLKTAKLRRSYAIDRKLYQKLDTAVTEVGPEAGKGWSSRDVDALARAAHALEKVQASAAGELQEVEVRGEVRTVSHSEVKVLIAALLNEAPPGEGSSA